MLKRNGGIQQLGVILSLVLVAIACGDNVDVTQIVEVEVTRVVYDGGEPEDAEATQLARAAEEKPAEATRRTEEVAEAARGAEEEAEATRRAEEEAEAARRAEEEAEAARRAEEEAAATAIALVATNEYLDQLMCGIDLSMAEQLSVNSSTGAISTSNVCWYRINNPARIELMTVSLVAQSGTFDLYLDSGAVTSPPTVMNADNLQNFSGPIDGDRTYAYIYPSVDYTLAVDPISGSGTFNLSVGVGQEIAPGQVSSGDPCPGIGVCQASVPLTLASYDGVSIGSEFGDRVIFPLEVTCPGTIRASADWTGSAERLALILNGPGQVGYFDRSDGNSPLTVQYNVTASDVHAGNRWFVTLTNFSGGTALGSVNMEYPDCGVGSSSSTNPQLSLTGTETYEANERQWVRYLLSVTNWSVFPPVFFQPAPHLPPCGQNSNASRAWVDIYNASNDQRIYGFCALGSPEGLTSLWFAVEQGTSPPAGVYIVINDRETGERYISNVVRP